MEICGECVEWETTNKCTGAKEFHPCPYKEEIYEDETTLCNCCEDRVTTCREEV